MAKIVRTTQKIFAGNSPSNQVTAFGTIKDGSPSYTKTPAQIMNTNYESGWSDAVEDDYAPYRQDRNAVDLTHSTQIAYILQEGIPEYDSGTTYYNGSIVKFIDGTSVKFYRSIADNNTSTLNDDTKWVLYLNVSNTGAINNPTFTGSVTIPTPVNSDNSTKAASTAYINNKFQVVQSLPANPDANVFYFVVG